MKIKKDKLDKAEIKRIRLMAEAGAMLDQECVEDKVICSLDFWGLKGAKNIDLDQWVRDRFVDCGGAQFASATRHSIYIEWRSAGPNARVCWVFGFMSARPSEAEQTIELIGSKGLSGSFRKIGGVVEYLDRFIKHSVLL